MKNQAALRTAVRVGAIAGGLCVAWVLMLYFTGQNPYGPKRLMTMFVPPVAVLVAQWRARKQAPEQFGFSMALLTGVVTLLLTASLSGLGVYTLARTGNPQLIEQNRLQMKRMIQAERANFLKEKGGKEQYERSIRGIASTPSALAQDDFSKKLLAGLFFFLPGAVFFRK
ncbi:DUF4199 domain-containing protein [Hymenobacter oligotrophus]|uniref:DUF4199 domain-containing protein n=1 Tax=Hymenobacter oligotrophus TaxID=2319843 RepID=A0A3B7QS19_9BACT|nr:DUF4199 domain-containing protein [Hymenobacter oligotrophus]AYA35778.1 DUF4199 domain-containing protein [Hymenobacter oligotrophus]